MSDANVEAARRANTALNTGDFDALLESFAQDCVFSDRQNAPDQPATVEGVEAIRESLKLWAGAFDKLRADVEEYIDVGDAVVCDTHWWGQGKASGISIDTRQFDVYKFHDGMVIAATLGFRSKEEALEAVGQGE